jgi:hypothetical protein
MEKRRLLWNLMALSLFGFVLAAVFTFTSCSDDPVEVTETLAGVYQMDNATLNDDVVDAKDSVIIPSGADVTLIMGGGIFGASPCQNPANSAIDMRDDGKLFFVCIGSESATPGVDAGSWTENSSLTTLTLSLNATVVPPLGFELSIISVSRSGSTVNGTIPGVPLPSTLLAQVFPTVTFPDIQIVGADIQFSEVTM